MTVSFSTFDRLKNKGVAAYKSGDYRTAKSYLVDAAECMIELAEQAKSPDTRRQHEELAAELIDLAKDCDQAGNKKGSARRGDFGLCRENGGLWWPAEALHDRHGFGTAVAQGGCRQRGTQRIQDHSLDGCNHIGGQIVVAQHCCERGQRLCVITNLHRALP